MKKLILKSFYTVAVLAFVYAFGMMTGSETFAFGAMVTVGVFSAMQHAGVFGNVALEAPVIPDFQHKTQVEINEMDDATFQKYMDDKQEYDTAVAAKATYDQIEELRKSINDDNKVQVETAIKGLEEMLKEQNTQTENLFLMIKAMSEKTSKEGKKESLKTLIEKNSDVLKSIKANKGNHTVGSTKFNITVDKAEQGAADIGDRDYLGQIEAGIEHEAVRNPNIQDLFRRQAVTSEFIHYWEEDVVTRDAKFVIACATSTHNTKKTWVKRTVELAKIRDLVDVCIDMMEDYAFVEGEIRMLIDESIKLKIDSELLLGASAASTDLLSIDFISSEFNAANVLADFSNSFQDANISDLTAAMKAQIFVFGQENKWNANVIIMNYVDKIKLLYKKDTDGNYLFPNIVFGATDRLNDMAIVTNPIVPANELYVMDTTKGKILDRRRLTVTASFENKDNIEHDLVTFVATERLQFHVRLINRDAFMKCSDISAALVALDPALP